ncbi:MAG: porin, partial [Candidatus Obscuribacterales bacterium]|nr:porin [Candidatus Obscuribacterales bacterium]
QQPRDNSSTDDSNFPAATSPLQAILQDPDAHTNNRKLAQSLNNPAIPSQSSDEPRRRSYPAPLDPVFPMTEYTGSAGTLPIGVPDTDPEFPMEREIYKVIPALKKHRIKIYGWANPGIDHSSSRYSNIPNSYAIVPNRLELDQLILRTERVPDSVQTEHCDWGFRSSILYGIDYRFTTAQGWYPATKQLLQHNALYGFDPVELYGMFYVPKVAQGLMLKFGRYISPPDIEAQLAPDNFMWTHSQMFTVDCYTQTGLLATIKLNDNWAVTGGVHAGNDIAPWDKAAIPSGELFVRWVSKTNNDSIYAGCDSINNGRFRGARAVLSQQQMIQSINTQIQQGVENGATGYTNFDGSTYQYNNLKPPAHDNLQQFNATWTHRFNKKGTIATFTECYFLYQYNSLTGGTVNNGPARTYYALTGPGTYINGIAPAVGVVNYTAFKVTDKDYICIRPVDYLMDYKGQRTGFATAYSSWTLNWTHRFNNLLQIRPEIRYDRALNTHNGSVIKPYDNGNRRFQFTFGLDLIARF